jgi:hypothetical protein
MTTLPVIHLNGTGRRSLAEEYEEAYSALVNAQSKLAEATCHPRDFYPLGDEAWSRAREEREIAQKKLREVKEYLGNWVNHCSQSPGAF